MNKPKLELNLEELKDFTKELSYKGQEWWEISRNPDPQQAMAEEMEEILEEAHWYRKLGWEVWRISRTSNYDSSKDIHNFWKKWSDGGHFWHPENKRWYSKN